VRHSRKGRHRPSPPRDVGGFYLIRNGEGKRDETRIEFMGGGGGYNLNKSDHSGRPGQIWKTVLLNLILR
jgi:hypothetical protein